MLRSNVVFTRLPRRAPQVLLGLATTGAWHGCHASVGGQETLSTDPQQNRVAQDLLQPNRLFFGYFLKAAQKKVSRLRVRIPDTKNRRDSDLIIRYRSSDA